MLTRFCLVLTSILITQPSFAVDLQVLEEMSTRPHLEGILAPEGKECSLAVKRIKALDDSHYTVYFDFDGKKGHVDFPTNEDLYPDTSYLKINKVRPSFGLEKNYIIVPPKSSMNTRQVDFLIEYRGFGDIDKESFVEGPCRVDLLVSPQNKRLI